MGKEKKAKREKKPAQDDPFVVVKPAIKVAGQDEPAIDDVQPSTSSRYAFFADKHLSGTQWSIAEVCCARSGNPYEALSHPSRLEADGFQALITALLDLVASLAARGSVKDCEYFLNQAKVVAGSVKSSVMLSRVAARSAQIQFRLRHYDQSVDRLKEASDGLTTVRLFPGCVCAWQRMG
jgi:hypothetical protein